MTRAFRRLRAHFGAEGTEENDFGRAFAEGGLSIEEFDSFGPTRRTLRQFVAGCGELGAIIRDFMLPEW